MASAAYVNIPLTLNKLSIRSSYELQIMGLALSLPDGICMSNSKLADLLNIEKRTVIRLIGSLKSRGYLRNAGSFCNRVLLPTGNVIRLLNNITTPRKLKQVIYKPVDAVDVMIDTLDEPTSGCDVDTADISDAGSEAVIDKAEVETLREIPEQDLSPVTEQVVIDSSPLPVTESEQKVTKSGSGSDSLVTHNINNNKNINNIYNNPLDLKIEKLAKAFGSPLGRYDRDNAIRYLRSKGIDWCLNAISENPLCTYLGECFKAYVNKTPVYKPTGFWDISDC